MTKYLDPKFQTGANSQKYRDNFDSVFSEYSLVLSFSSEEELNTFAEILMRIPDYRFNDLAVWRSELKTIHRMGVSVKCEENNE